MSLQSNELRREEFHRYLEKSGVMDYFSRVLVALYELPEKPADPNEFIREQLSIAFPDDTDYLCREIQVLEDRLNHRNLIYNEMVDLNYQYTKQLKDELGYQVSQEEIDALFEPEPEQPTEAKTDAVPKEGAVVAAPKEDGVVEEVEAEEEEDPTAKQQAQNNAKP